MTRPSPTEAEARTPRDRAVRVLDELVPRLEALDRGPFRDVLARLLGVRPSLAALEKFANKSPDRWAQALAVLGALAGYERGALVNIGLFDVKGMSDSQLMAEAQRLGLPVVERPTPAAREAPPPSAGEETGG